jgi:hypothetical protein
MKRHPATMAQPGHLIAGPLLLEQTAPRRAALSRAANRNKTLSSIKPVELNWKAKAGGK